MDKKQLKKDMPGYEALWGKYSEFRSRGNLAPEWSDFWAFYNWVIDHGWEPGTNIIVDWTRLIGPDNCLLKVTVRRAMPENNADAPPRRVHQRRLQEQPLYRLSERQRQRMPVLRQLPEICCVGGRKLGPVQRLRPEVRRSQWLNPD